MTLVVEQFVRKSFPVDAVHVTPGNMEDVAKWCDGELRVEDNERGTEQQFIKVRVHNPLTERQTKAFVGDWVLYAGKGYKVYTDKAFRKSFDEQGVPKARPLPPGLTARMVDDGQPSTLKNVFAEHGGGAGGGSIGALPRVEFGGGGGNSANPGGTSHV